MLGEDSAPVRFVVPARDSVSQAESVSSWRARQREHFMDLLGRKWQCVIPGHKVCVPTADGKHNRISDEKFAVWVDAVCQGEATTSQPPAEVLSSCTDDALFNRMAEVSFRAVSVPPSRRRNVQSPALAATASLRESLHDSSQASSGIPGPGYYSGKALKWIGEKCLNAIEEVIIFKRSYQHQYHLKRWGRIRSGKAGVNVEQYFFRMLEDLLEMSRDCYSVRVNQQARVGIDQTYNYIHARKWTKESASYFSSVNLCVLPIDLVDASRNEPLICDLLDDLRHAVTKAPLSLQDPQRTSEVIQILGRYLMYSPYQRCHRAIGYCLSGLLRWTMRQRELTLDETSVIHAMAVQRLERPKNASIASCRPWEVATFALCAQQDLWLKEAVKDASGLQSLFNTLHDIRTTKSLVTTAEEWESIDTIINALYHLSEYDWVVDAIGSDKINLLLYFLRESMHVHNSLFRICSFAIRILNQIVAHHSAALGTLIREKAVPVFERFVYLSVPRGTSEFGKRLKKDADHAAWTLLEKMGYRGEQSTPGARVN